MQGEKTTGIPRGLPVGKRIAWGRWLGVTLMATTAIGLALLFIAPLVWIFGRR